MKTSNKILLGLFAAVITLMCISAYDLKKQYQQGKKRGFDMESVNISQFSAIHIVKHDDTQFGVKVEYSPKTHIRIPQELIDFVKYKVKNDTLFVELLPVTKDGITFYNLQRDVEVYVPTLASIYSKNARVFFGLNVPRLTIKLINGANLEMNSVSKIDSLTLNANQTSMATIGYGNQIKVLKANFSEQSRLTYLGRITKKLELNAGREARIEFSGENLKHLRK